MCEMRGIEYLRQKQKRSLSFYGDKNLLFKLQSSLLHARNAPKDPRRHALFRAANDLLSSGDGDETFDREQKRKAQTGKSSGRVNK